MTSTTLWQLLFVGTATAVSLLPMILPFSSAWVLESRVVHHHHHPHRSRLLMTTSSSNTNLYDNYDHHPEDSASSWSVTDDWNKLSEDATVNPRDSDDAMLSSRLDAASLAALRMQNFGMNVRTRGTLSQPEEWLEKTIDGILTLNAEEEEDVDELPSLLLSANKQQQQQPQSTLPKDSSSSSTPQLDTERFLDSMGDEIALLIRCNQEPHTLLIEQGRAVAELSDAERHDVRQLVVLDYDSNSNDNNNPTWKATPFLREACATMFQQHSVAKQRLVVNGGDDDSLHKKEREGAVLDRAGIASWMNQCLSNEIVGQHEKRVTQTLARYGRGGVMTLDDMVQMYVSVVTGNEQQQQRPGNKVSVTSFTRIDQLERHRAPEIEAVWRDIRNHGIVSPAEFERNMKVAALKQQQQHNALKDDDIAITEHTILDECELLTEEEETSLTTDRHGRSSHEHVELVPSHEATTPIPVWIKDGEFVFIDEQSCIGCMQCVTTAPASFQMIDHHGRARTFQRNGPDVKSAVHSCPVSCMHYVSFDELQELETARDEGVADDHRHFGHTSTRGYIAPTPLHVSRRSSDSNHKSSFYHYLRNKCCESTKCPGRGCYDCPRFSEPGRNPFFQKRLAKATHARAQFFIKTGQADSFRKIEEL